MTEWQWSSFADLPNADLYEWLAQRQNVFVLEQQCLYPDLDGYDQDAWHLLGWKTIDGKRQLAPAWRGSRGREYDYSRSAAAVNPGGARYRRLRDCSRSPRRAAAPGPRIRIGAHQYLEAFYAASASSRVRTSTKTASCTRCALKRACPSSQGRKHHRTLACSVTSTPAQLTPGSWRRGSRRPRPASR